MAGRMTAAAQPIEFDGVVWQMSPLTDRQYDELTEWSRSHVIQAAEIAIRNFPDCTVGEADRLLRVALTVALELTWQSEVGQRLFATPLGVSQMFWQSVVKLKPKATELENRHLFYKPDNVRKVLRAFFDINSRSEDKPDPQTPAAESGTDAQGA